MTDDMVAVLKILAQSENAMSLADFVQVTDIPTERVFNALGILVAIHVLNTDNSFHKNEIGEMVYMAGTTDEAQAIFEDLSK